MRIETLKTYLPAALIALFGFIIAFQFVDPAPPSTLTLSAGQPGGAYQAYAEQFRTYLGERGVTVKVLTSAGSGENLKRLADKTADVAFVQGGMADAGQDQLLSLGSLYYEPLWVFTRSDSASDRLTSFRGKRIAVGNTGSGTRALAIQLLAANGVTAVNSTLLDLPAQDAVAQLMNGAADAAFFVASPKSAQVQQLLHAPSIHLMHFNRADAYSRNMHFLSAIDLPEGAIDLERNIPATETKLLATTATLLIHQDFHPALQMLMLQAAASITSKAGLFEKANEFPSPVYSDLPVSEEAERYYKSGPPLLQRVLPFWAATMVDRLKVMLLPFLALLLPLFKIMPPLYRWRVRSRIYRWYSKLGEIDRSLHEHRSGEINAMAELDRIEADIRKINVPLSYADELYNLRLHLALIRDLVREADAAVSKEHE